MDAKEVSKLKEWLGRKGKENKAPTECPPKVSLELRDYDSEVGKLF